MQARRNERLAYQLLNEDDAIEWVVTITFYSGLHYVEAAFSQLPSVKHSETSMPSGWNRSIHAWREDLILIHYSSIYNAYRKLSTQSMIARYLVSNSIPINEPVEDFFNKDDVGKFLDRDLDKIKRKTGITTS